MPIVQDFKRVLIPTLKRFEKLLQTDLTYLIKGGIWITFGQGLSAVSSFLLAIAFGHLVSKEDYGLYKYALSLYGIIITFSLTGLSTTVTQAIANGYPGTLRKAFRLSLKWSWPMAITAFALAAYFCWKNNASLTYAMLIIGVSAPLLRAFQLYGSYYQGTKQFRTSSGLSALADVITATILFAVMTVKANPIALLSAFFISHTSLNAIFYKLTVKNIPQYAPTDFSQVRFGRHLSIQIFFTSLAAQFDKILIFNFLGPEQLAIYTIAIAIPKQIRATLSFIGTISIAKYATKNIDQLLYSVKHKFLVSQFFLIPVLLLYEFLAPSIFQFLFPKYPESVFISQIFCIYILTFGNLSPIALQVKKEIKLTYILHLTSSITQVLLMFLLIKPFGLTGVIVGIVTAKYLVSTLSYLLLRYVCAKEIKTASSQ